MVIDSFIVNKFKFFENALFDKLNDKTNKSLYKHKLAIKKVVNSSIQQTLKQSDSNYSINQEIVDSITLENDREKSHFGAELHNGLEQVLASLSFYIEALQSSKKITAKSKNQYLNKVKELTQMALTTSNEVANNLMSNQLTDRSLISALLLLSEKKMAKHPLKIIQKFDNNFSEARLNISKKHEVFKIIETVLYYFISTNYKETLTINYTFKYDSILQIDFSQSTVIFELDAFEKFPITGYNHLRHRLELLHARLLQKGDHHLIIKTSISNQSKEYSFF